MKAAGKYDDYRVRYSMLSKKCRERVKQRHNSLPSVQQKQKQKEAREATRIRVAKCRALKKKEAAATQSKQKSPFNSAQAFAKATSRARRLMNEALPKTQRRRKIVCKKLYQMECSDH